MGTLRETVARTAMSSQGGMTHHYQNPVAIRFGAGSIVELPDVLASRRAVLVTFPEAEGLGLVARLRAILGPALAGMEDRIEPNPDVSYLAQCTSAFGATTVIAKRSSRSVVAARSTRPRR